jgi:hypothetical protein
MGDAVDDGHRVLRERPATENAADEEAANAIDRDSQPLMPEKGFRPMAIPPSVRFLRLLSASRSVWLLVCAVVACSSFWGAGGQQVVRARPHRALQWRVRFSQFL